MGLEAIKYLKEYIDRAKVEDPEEAPKIINYELCSVSKIKYLIFCYINNKKPVIKPFK